MRKLIIVAAVTAVAAVTLGPAASIAFADSGSASATQVVGVVKWEGTESFNRPTSSSMPVHHSIAQDTRVLVSCQMKGEVVSDNPYWYRIALHDKLGFVPAGNVHLFNPKDITTCA